MNKLFLRKIDEKGETNKLCALCKSCDDGKRVCDEGLAALGYDASVSRVNFSNRAVRYSQIAERTEATEAEETEPGNQEKKWTTHTP